MRRQSVYFKRGMVLLVLFLGSIATVQAANVLVSWSANTESDLVGYKVYYGTSAGTYGAPINVGNVTSYTLTGLNSGTFDFAVKAYDTSGNESGFSTEVSLTVVAAPDTAAPIISSVQSTNITSISATIAWSTNEPSDSQVDDGPTTAYGSSTSINTNLVTSHSQTLNGLTPGTPYNFRVRSRDAAGNVATSGNFTFATPTINTFTPIVVNFDNPAPSGSPDSLLSGTIGDINFGSNQWRWSGPYSACPTNSIYFDSTTGTSRTLAFSSPMILNSLTVYTTSAGTLTLSDNMGQSRTQSVTTGSLQLVTTGWANASTIVTFSFSAGWSLGIDEIQYSSVTPPSGGWT